MQQLISADTHRLCVGLWGSGQLAAEWRMYLRAKRIDALLLRGTALIALLAQPNWRELA